MTERRTIRELQSQPPAHLARCRALLVETAVALVIWTHVAGPARDILVARLAIVLPDLDAVIDPPMHAICVAADRLVRAWQDPDAVQRVHEAENRLRYVLHLFFVARSDAALARFNGASDPDVPDLIER